MKKPETACCSVLRSCLENSASVSSRSLVFSPAKAKTVLLVAEGPFFAVLIIPKTHVQEKGNLLTSFIPPPDLMNNQTFWLTAKEAAAYLRVEPRTVLAWARQGKVKGYVLSGTLRQTWRFLHADLDAMLTMPAVLPESEAQ